MRGAVRGQGLAARRAAARGQRAGGPARRARRGRDSPARPAAAAAARRQRTEVTFAL